MEYNEYATQVLIRQRHAELLEEAHRLRLAKASKPPRRPLRVTIGTGLIRWGAWLLRERYPSVSAS